MIVSPDRLRKPLAWLALILFVIFTILVMTNNPVLGMVDSVVQEFGEKIIPGWLLIIATPFYAFSHGILNGLLIFALAFFLWGFKFKIPAAWLLMTNVFGWVLINLVSLILHHPTPLGTAQYPTHATFFSLLLSTYLLLIVVPELRRPIWRVVAQVIIVVAALLVVVKAITVGVQTVSDALAGWLLAAAWIQASELFYVKNAANYRRMNGFKNSWY